MAERPDIILMPGDYFQGNGQEWPVFLPAFRQVLNELDAPGGVFLVQGDCESFPRLYELAEGTRAQVLVNQVVRTRVRDRDVTIGGIELSYKTPEAGKVIRELEQTPGADDIRILLAHRPDPLLKLEPQSRIDLIVAGHTHGGQIVLPLLGPPVTATSVPQAIARGGLHTLHDNRIYISRGVGHERGQAPRIRFLCPPEISLLTLTGDSRSAP
jgi:predicted MPP superfamily phosphohydrolase